MKVSMQVYGEQAKTLARELGLGCENKNASLTMTANFSYRDVEGHTVVAAEFTSTEQKVVVKSTEQKTKEALKQEAECAVLRAELASMSEGF